MSAAIRRIWTGCESSPASSPTLSTSALAEDVVVVVVPAVAVTGTVGVVLVLCTGGASSASDSGNLTRVRSATDCVVVPGVVSWLGAAGAVVVAVSGSSGGLTCTLGIGPIRMGSRSLRTFNGLPRVTGVGFHGPRSWRSREWCSNAVSPLCVTTHDYEPCHSVYRSNAHLFAVTSEPNAFEPCGFQFVHQCSSSSTRNSLSYETCVESSRMLLSLSLFLLWNLVYCQAACRGNQVSGGLSALMVIPEFFSI